MPTLALGLTEPTGCLVALISLALICRHVGLQIMGGLRVGILMRPGPEAAGTGVVGVKAAVGVLVALERASVMLRGTIITAKICTRIMYGKSMRSHCLSS